MEEMRRVTVPLDAVSVGVLVATAFGRSRSTASST